MTAPLRARASTFLIAFPIIAIAALLPAQAEARAEATSAPTVAAEAATARGAAAADRGDFAEALRWMLPRRCAGTRRPPIRALPRRRSISARRTRPGKVFRRIMSKRCAG